MEVQARYDVRSVHGHKKDYLNTRYMDARENEGSRLRHQRGFEAWEISPTSNLRRPPGVDLTPRKLVEHSSDLVRTSANDFKHRGTLTAIRFSNSLMLFSAVVASRWTLVVRHRNDDNSCAAAATTISSMHLQTS